jgi:hypothetical protein
MWLRDQSSLLRPVYHDADWPRKLMSSTKPKSADRTGGRLMPKFSGQILLTTGVFQFLQNISEATGMEEGRERL